MNISVKVMIDDHSKDTDTFICTDMLLNDSMTISDLQNLYQQSNDNETYVISRGEILLPYLRLSEVGLCDGSCIKLVIKNRLAQSKMEFDEDSIKDIIKKHRQMMKTRFKRVINDSLERGLDSVMDHEYGLDKDLLAFSIASDYRLLRTLLSSTENVSKLLQRCPVLIPAALKIINIIQDKLKKVVAQHSSAPEQDPRYFSLGEVEQSDDSSDNEDTEEDQGSLQMRPPVTAAISRSQLREAISGVRPSTIGNRVPGGEPPRPVSLSQLRSAIHTAIGSQEPMEVDGPPDSSPGPGATPGHSDIDQKVDHLCMMGFSNREANREALDASGGNIAAAIEFLLN